MQNLRTLVTDIVSAAGGQCAVLCSKPDNRTASLFLVFRGDLIFMICVCMCAAFNYLSSQGYTFLIVADEAFGRQIPFAFLERVRDEWFSKWADKGAAATAHSLDKSFGGRLRHWMEYCETHPDEVSKVAAVQKKVDEVKGIMVENIERVLERGEKIELLVDKTDNLRFQADKFHKTGRALRSKMWWQNFKIQIIVVIVLILLGVVIFVSVCFSGGNCLK